MGTIYLFKKASTSAPALSGPEFDEASKAVNSRSKVRRDATVAYMLDGRFRRAPIVPQRVIDSQFDIMDNLDKGFAIPESDLGRVGIATPSSAESVRAWIKDRICSTMGINRDSIGIVYVKGE